GRSSAQRTDPKRWACRSDGRLDHQNWEGRGELACDVLRLARHPRRKGHAPPCAEVSCDGHRAFGGPARFIQSPEHGQGKGERYQDRKLDPSPSDEPSEELPRADRLPRWGSAVGLGDASSALSVPLYPFEGSDRAKRVPSSTHLAS